MGALTNRHAPCRHALPGLRRVAALSMPALACCLAFASCAVIDRDHRHLTVVVEKTLIPEDNYVLTAASSPVWATGGLVALVADGLVLNPVFAAPKALDDATLPFTGFGLIGPLEAVLIVPRVVAVPIVFVGSEIARCTIPYVF